MNENPGETPNPLNPNPEGSPEANDVVLDANPSEPVESTSMAQPEQVDPLMQATDGITNQPSSDPMSRPMEQAPVAEPVAAPKKKKTGLIIGIIVAVLVAVGCGVVAAIMLSGQGDPVSKAVLKIMEGKSPANAAVNGTIEITPTDKTSVLTGLKIDLKADTITNSMINHATANVTASLKQAGDVEVEVEEIYAESGDLYLKIDGLVEAIDSLNTLSQNTNLTTNCIDDPSMNCEPTVLEDCIDEEGNVAPCETTTVETVDDTSSEALAMLSYFSSAIEVIDGEWLRIPVDQLKSIAESMDSNNSLSCLADIAQDAKNNSNSIAELYRKYPFVGSTTEGVSIASKNSTVYRVMFDREKFTNYSNTLKDSTIVKKAISCLGEDNVTVNDDAVDELSKLPNIYVEIDNDGNFSRLYFETTLKGTTDDCYCPDGAECSACLDEPTETSVANVTVDLGFTYPDTIKVAEPTDYQDMMTVLQQLFLTLDSDTNYDDAVTTE